MQNLILNKHAKFKRDWAENNTLIVIKVKTQCYMRNNNL